jgi:outer membrane protein assembly factor BamB
VVVGENVVFADLDGRVVALGRSSGTAKWTQKFPGPFLGEALLLVGGRIIVPEYALRALDPIDGSILWSYTGPDGRSGHNAPAVSGDTLYVADGGGIAAALDAATGVPHWTLDVGEALFGPIVHGSYLIYGTRGYFGGPRQGPLGAGHVVAIDRFAGAEVWRTPIPDADEMTLSGGSTNGGAVAGGVLVVPAMNAVVYGLELDSGDVLWERVGGSVFNVQYQYSPQVIGGLAVTLRIDHLAEAFDPVNGDVEWTSPVAGLGHLQRCGERLCLSTGRFWAISATGGFDWAYGGGTTGLGFLGMHTIDTNGIVYVGATLNDAGVAMAMRPPILLAP